MGCRAVPAWVLTVCLGAAGIVAGCDHLALPPANHTTGGAGAVAAHVLPSDLAGPPETLNLPRRSQPSPTILILRRRGEIQIYSRDAHWRGRRVTVYYVPPENVEVRRGEHYLQSSAGLQRIGSAPVDAAGGWRVTWHTGAHDLPGPRTYLLAQTDTGQIGLASFET
ncbi:hypothetical protein SAMN05421543_101391 [Alicyclobacillus macrosporangiidus]|uniref:Intracellular proteinase inhibitor n=1 Tax=Alicyclobacillus macrosporangiidus TaxID=392015 RepID=A0A1I7FQ42_9BACL|nr:hypothetical protein SAMN05421543_101391 [Alicyclobacillus macrosporangiidus]